MLKNVSQNYLTRVSDRMDEIASADWDGLLERQQRPTPFMRHAYLSALQTSGSAVAATGWTLQVFSLWRGDVMAAACPLYLKTHSRGEYVFDWAWAEAYERHGLAYYPKAVIASPFTPVPGSRLLAEDAAARQALLQVVLDWCRQHVPSLHVLFPDDADLQACRQASLMQREQVQFHWHNPGWRDFEDFLASLSQDKRKKIRQERRKVHEAGVRFRVLEGHRMSAQDWALVQRCYVQTYLEHGNPPYLQPGFFESMRNDMQDAWLVFMAEMGDEPVGMSLIGLQRGPKGQPEVAYGRYWGALRRVDCLHFEACYYQPLEWCIAQGVQRFEGGAQGEHKMARALLPVRTSSAHWLAHPSFAQAVDHFLERERQGVHGYLESLEQHSPLRKA